MAINIYIFNFSPDWMQLFNRISQLDRFDASWTTIEKKEGQTLKQLKSIATVNSVGSSTRIEGSKMTDDEVEALIRNIRTAKLEERDEQEVAGYFEALELIAESYRDIAINESNIKHLHNTMLKHSKKDEWHRGNYKQHPNHVEVKETGQVLFRTTEPGMATDNAMSEMVKWYGKDGKTPPLIKDAIFVYEFLSIHPFQDGNGRLSRLLGTLLLLKHGYSWVQYVSFEHEIENRKAEYYRVLMQCQGKRPNEEVAPWVDFFIDCLMNIQAKLEDKLKTHQKNENISKRERMIYSFVENHPSSRSGEIASKLNIPLPTVKRILSTMVASNQLAVTGAGVATSYTIQGSAKGRKDQTMIFTMEARTKEFTLKNQSELLEVKKIVLTPLFEWTHPSEWGNKLSQNGLRLIVTCTSASGTKIQAAPIFIMASPYHYQPVFEFDQPYQIPTDPWESIPYKKEFPIQVNVTLDSSTEKIDFDVMVIYDQL